MIKNIITSAVTALVAVVVALSLYSTGTPDLGGKFSTEKQYFNDGIETTAGTSTFAGPIVSTSRFILGTSGSNLGFVKTGTCDLVGGAIAATSSAVADCAVTGVVSGDIVIPTLATSTANAVATGARASTTAGYITVRLLNLTGAASSVSALGSSTSYIVLRP